MRLQIEVVNELCMTQRQVHWVIYECLGHEFNNNTWKLDEYY